MFNVSVLFLLRGLLLLSFFLFYKSLSSTYMDVYLWMQTYKNSRKAYVHSFVRVRTRYCVWMCVCLVCARACVRVCACVCARVGLYLHLCEPICFSLKKTNYIHVRIKYNNTKKNNNTMIKIIITTEKNDSIGGNLGYILFQFWGFTIW